MRPADSRTPLTESQPIPAEQVGWLADQAIGQYEQLTRDGHPAGEALWPPVDDPAAAERAAAIDEDATRCRHAARTLAGARSPSVARISASRSSYA